MEIYCEIDYCPEAATSTMTVEREEKETIYLYFCKPHTMEINQRMAQQLGSTVLQLDLYRGKIAYTTEDLRKVLDYMDAEAAKNACNCGIDDC
jgi:hypothetical protein